VIEERLFSDNEKLCEKLIKERLTSDDEKLNEKV